VLQEHIIWHNEDVWRCGAEKILNLHEVMAEQFKLNKTFINNVCGDSALVNDWLV